MTAQTSKLAHELNGAVKPAKDRRASMPSASAGRPEENPPEDDGRQADHLQQRIGALRGTQVRVDTRRSASIVAAVCLVTIAVASVALFVAGARKNAQIAELQDHGVNVVVTISGCQGLLGGSGSNDAGYACRATFHLQGRTYNDAIPGDTLHPPGTKLAAVTTDSDPALISTPAILGGERPSAKVFLIPAVLAAVFLIALAAILVAKTRARRAAGAGRAVGAKRSGNSEGAQPSG